ncbi:MAG: class I SAM-dependent methyltransferase, partial [Flavobacteriales bacterium]
CDLPFEDNQYDLILCNHVLEHIPDDIKAMRELYRVLKKDGTLIAQVPLEEKRETTFEDDTIIDKKERTRIFGQYDHLRVYGKDYYFRLQSVGFKAEGIDFLASLSNLEKEFFALPKKERIPVAIKK